VIQDILKEIAQTQQVDQNARHRFKGESQCRPLVLPSSADESCLPLLVVVINEADGLSRDAQSALRRTMEKYMSNLRLILCATSTSRIIAPIRSRCLLMRVGAPTEAETSLVLKHVAKKEKFQLPDEVVHQIYGDCNGNLRKAILVLETLRMQR
jgi:replication factor C subunit 3/5